MFSSAAPHLLHKCCLVSLLLLIAIFAAGCGQAKHLGANTTNVATNANKATSANTTTTTTTNTSVNVVNANLVMANTNRSNTDIINDRAMQRRTGNFNKGAEKSDEAETPEEIPTKDKIAEQIHKLPWGEIARDIPREMRVGEPKSVRVYIAKRITDNPSAGVPEVAQVSKVKLAPVMGAFLISADADAFEITRVYPKDKDVQGVGGDQTTEWIWSVKPLKSGNYKLEVRATVELIIPGHENQLVTQTVFSDGVTVKVNPFYSVKQFLKDYWYIITALILTPLGWYFNKRWGAPK